MQHLGTIFFVSHNVGFGAVDETEWMRSGASTWIADGAKATALADEKYGAKMLHVVWPVSTASPLVEVTSRFQTRDRFVDLSAPGTVKPLSDVERKFYTEEIGRAHV